MADSGRTVFSDVASGDAPVITPDIGFEATGTFPYSGPGFPTATAIDAGGWKTTAHYNVAGGAVLGFTVGYLAQGTLPTVDPAAAASGGGVGNAVAVYAMLKIFSGSGDLVAQFNATPTRLVADGTRRAFSWNENSPGSWVGEPVTIFEDTNVQVSSPSVRRLIIAELYVTAELNYSGV